MAGTDVEPAFRFHESSDHFRARAVLGHLVAEDRLGQLLAEAIVEIAVVEGEPLEREAGVLEDMAAAPAS